MNDLIVHDARDIANFFLDEADRKSIALSITSLLKIIYFAHGWHLALFKRPLVGQPFEAWQFGPVVRVVYDSFKVESGQPIKSRAKKLNPKSGKFEVCHCDAGVGLEPFLISILDSYAKFHPYTLSDMTHDPNSPWTEVWNRADIESVPGMRISNDAIQAYFLSLNAADIYRV